MANTNPQKKKIPKGTKKKFFEVEIPLTSAKVHLYDYNQELLIGNTIKLDLSKTLRGKNLELRARVKLEDKKLIGDIISLELNRQYIRKVMRKGSDYVEDSILTDCKDSSLEIKPFIITRKRVSRVVRKTLREQARKFIETKTTTRNTEELLIEIMTNKLQKEMSLKLKKTYPLALCEIRSIKILKILEPEKPEAKKETKTKKETKQ